MRQKSPEELKSRLEDSLEDIKKSYSKSVKTCPVKKCEVIFLRKLGQTLKSYKETKKSEYLEVFDEAIKKYDNFGLNLKNRILKTNEDAIMTSLYNKEMDSIQKYLVA